MAYLNYWKIIVHNLESAKAGILTLFKIGNTDFQSRFRFRIKTHVGQILQFKILKLFDTFHVEGYFTLFT